MRKSPDSFYLADFAQTPYGTLELIRTPQTMTLKLGDLTLMTISPRPVDMSLFNVRSLASKEFDFLAQALFRSETSEAFFSSIAKDLANYVFFRIVEPGYFTYRKALPENLYRPITTKE